MNKYLLFVKKYILEMAFVILACGAAGSLKGASVESWLRADVTYQIPKAAEMGVTRPYMEGIFRLAADENMWYNLRYALKWGLAGAVGVFLLSLIAYWCIGRCNTQKTI